MSTPDTPSHTPTPDAADTRATLPDASGGDAPTAHPTIAGSSQNPNADAAPSPVDASAAPGAEAEPSPTLSNGHTPDAGESEGEGEGEEEPVGAEAAGAAAGTPEQGDRKRRRRRRKKKGPGSAQPGVEGAVAAEGGDAAEAVEATGEAAAAEGASAEKAEARPKRKERRPAPQRERPPVNGGDIIFGKILEITDDAILVDIPGKAHAIFDRREMLIPEEEEAPPRAQAAAPRPEAEAAQPVGGEDAATGLPEEGAPATAEGGSVTEAEPAAEVEAAEAGAEVAAEAAAPSTDEGELATAHSDSPSPEPLREPKVPRVILEVGADFIGVVHNDGARGGLVVLTHHPRRAERAKPVIEKAFQDKATIEALVTGVIKGGIEVDVDGVRAFAPGSHVDLRLGADLSYLVGLRLPFLVTQYAKRGRDVVLSRKTMLEDESRKARTDALAKLKVGEELDGIVRSVVPFGAFVDVGGIEGLVPLKEMSHNRSDGPSDVFKAGEPTRVKVVMIDDKGKVWLSRRATIPDPWQQVAAKYAVGTRHSGKIVRLKDFGAFVELESGVDGLIHTQDLTIRRIEDPSEVVKVGDSLDVVVSHVDGSNHKIALHPAPQGDAAGEAPQRVIPHKPVKAKVANIESGGLVVRILGVTGRSARGYVTAAATGTPRGTELRKVFNIGQEIEGKVIEIDPRRGEVKLSIKALSEDQERNAYQQYRQQLKAEARFTFGDLLAKKGTTPSR
jgi:small subunit ribosomal protein S1